MRKFKKVVTSLLSLAMCLGLAACGGSVEAGNSAVPSQVADSSANPVAAATPSHPTQPAASYELTDAEGFINGWAYIEFQDTRTGSEYRGVIDTEGKLHAYFNNRSSVSGISASYKDGSGRFYGKKHGSYSYYMIDPEGQIHTYAEFEDVSDSCTYRDGYSCVIERKSGFDGTEYISHIYDPDGTELMSGSIVPYGNSPGGGILLFLNSDVQTSPSTNILYGADLYFSQSDTWVRGQALGGQHLMTYKLDDGIWVYRCSVYSDHNELDNGEVCYADVQGNAYTITVPAEYGMDPCYLCATNGVLLFADRDYRGLCTGTVYCYDTATGQWTLYQGAYQDNTTGEGINTAAENNGFAVAGDGYFTLQLAGADGRGYWILLNEKLEELTEPILGEVAKIADGVVYVIDGYTLKWYDISGKLLCTFGNDGYSLNNKYLGIENGIVCMSYFNQNKDHVIGYYNADGSSAFEIDFSTGTEVTMAS